MEGGGYIADLFLGRKIKQGKGVESAGKEKRRLGCGREEKPSAKWAEALQGLDFLFPPCLSSSI